MVELFIESFDKPPTELILDFDATDDPIHGRQEGAFFHGYYKNYCYLPLYVFCGDRLVTSYLRPSNIDASKNSRALLKLLVKRLRQTWPEIRRQPIPSALEQPGVHPARNTASHRALRHGTGKSAGGHDPEQAAENRRDRDPQRATNRPAIEQRLSAAGIVHADCRETSVPATSGMNRTPLAREL